MTTTADFGIRIPTMTEIRDAFGSLERAIECTRCDLPTVLYFLANPGRIAGFRSPKGARRVGHADFARKLREAASEDRKAAKEKAARERATLLQVATAGALAEFDPKRVLSVRYLRIGVMKWMRERRNPWEGITPRDIRAAVEAINSTLHAEAPRWKLPAVRQRKPRGKPGDPVTPKAATTTRQPTKRTAR